MATNLKRIGERARKEVKCRFTSIFHHVYDLDHLRACYESMEKGKKPGMDGETKESYGENLEANLKQLSEQLARMGWKPKPVRRVYIPKPGSRKRRPLGIPCFEDKLVQLALVRVLEEIYEADFLDCSYGYRAGRSQHQVVDRVGRVIQRGKVSYVAEADIEGFFERVNHDWMRKFLEVRIGDERVLRLIWRMLKAGVMEEGLETPSEQGTPQGGVLSALLSNVYLHYALDLWVERRLRRQFGGQMYYFRYADDFVACFQYRGEVWALCRGGRTKTGRQARNV
jgi:group II intron reverse transcriptase/maturase